MTRFNMFTDVELDMMEEAFCNEGLKRLVFEIRQERSLRMFVEPQESEKINCKATKCENCKNHNYCDYEPREREDKE